MELNRINYLNDICEQATQFQTNFINDYLWIYTLRAYLLNQVPNNLTNPVQRGPLRGHQIPVLTPNWDPPDPVYEGIEAILIAVEILLS